MIYYIVPLITSIIACIYMIKEDGIKYAMLAMISVFGFLLVMLILSYLSPAFATILLLLGL